MNDQQYFMTASLSYQLKAAKEELASFWSGKAYVKLRADYESISRSQNATKKLQKERDGFSFSRKLNRTIAELLDIVADLKNRNAELDEKRKKALADYYETAVKLEEAQGLIVKLRNCM